MTFCTREGNRKDYGRLKPIHKEVHDFHVKGRPDKYRPSEETLDEGYFNSLIDEPDGRIYIIENDRRDIIGFTFLRLKSSPDRRTYVKETQLFIEDIGVAEAYKGKGLGKMLFEKAVEIAKELKAESLELGVWEFNQNAIQFYESLGMNTQVRRMEMKIK